MKERGLAWLGTRTREFEVTSRFFRDTLGLRVEHEEPNFAIFRLPNEDTVEVCGPGDRDHMHFETGPVVGLLVDDVDEARARLEASGISLIDPVHRPEDGATLSHFVGPDANVYELAGERPQT